MEVNNPDGGGGGGGGGCVKTLRLPKREQKLTKNEEMTKWIGGG